MTCVLFEAKGFEMPPCPSDITTGRITYKTEVGTYYEYREEIKLDEPSEYTMTEKEYWDLHTASKLTQSSNVP